MGKERLTQQLHAYAHWKADAIKHLKAYQGLLTACDMTSPEMDLRIDDVADALSTDNIVIAFVAEFSRGKTELINAIFFADYKRRLLPSDAGRTTMCPTELFHDNTTGEAYVRLLPIETRLEDISLAEHKRNQHYWTTLPLDISSADKMAEAFREVIKVKRVSVEEATRLGLYEEPANGEKPAHIEIPMWRHALISFPHPLLKEGLVILDTPGLNALGTEPELTMDMLPNAHAVIFVLGADTGVTKTDMEMWQQHVSEFGRGRKGLVVALNKVDTMWDELEDNATVAGKIAKQCAKTAETLGIDPAQVFPVSAQKGLLGKVKQDMALLNRSGILAVESVLSDDILPSKQRIVRDRVVNEIGGMVDNTRRTVAARLGGAQKEFRELQSLDAKNTAMISHLLKTTREESIAYEARVENFQTSRRVLTKQVNEILEYLNIQMLDKVIAKSRDEMTGSWTTSGLKDGMKIFFDNTRHTMNQVNWIAEQANESVLAIYKRFHDDFGLADIKPVLYSANAYATRLERLCQRAEEYRNSPVMTMTEQKFVVKKFFISIVSHARDIFFKAHQEAESWAKAALAPLAMEIKERKQTLQKRVENLSRIKESRDTLESKLKELARQVQEQEKQLARLEEIYRALHQPLPFDAPAEPAPPQAQTGT